MEDQEQAAQEQAAHEQAQAEELAYAMDAERTQQQQAAQTERLGRQQAMMQQAAAAMQAQQGEGGASDKQYRQMAKQMTKQYKIKIESLKKDLDTEWGVFGSPFYFPIMVTLTSISAFISFITLGTISSLLDWFIFVTMPIVRVQRAWTKGMIMYSSAERQVKRRAILYQRQIWNTTKRTLMSTWSAVPIINMFSVWPWLTVLDKIDEGKHQKRLKQLKEKVRATEQRINRLTVRAKSGSAQYQIALFAMRVVKSMDDEFLKV
ncbi:MAG: hypothetical protein Q7S16_01460 [bacterium]|nr:hypothetical protein [bacterium]